MSNADQVRLAYAKEVTFKVSPTSTYKILNYTGESLAQRIQTVTSNTITTDAQVQTVKRVGVNTDGAINFELAGGAYDDLLLAMIRAASFSAVGTPVTNMSVTGANTFTGTGITLAAGDWIAAYGFTNRENNGVHRVVSSTSTTAVVDSTLVVEASAAGKTIKKAGQAINGVQDDSFTFEKAMLDLSNEFVQYPGTVVPGGSISVNMQQIITGSFPIMGVKEVSAAAQLGSAYTPAVTNEALATVDEFSGPWAIVESGTITKQVARQISFNIGQQPRSNSNLGVLEAQAIKKGQFAISGTWQQYYASKTIIDKYLAFSRIPFTWGTLDSAGNGYAFDFPAVRFTQATRVAGGINTDVIADMSWTAYKDPTLGYTVRVLKF